MNCHRELNEIQQLHAENLFQYESCGCNCSLMPLGYLVFFFFFWKKLASTKERGKVQGRSGGGKQMKGNQLDGLESSGVSRTTNYLLGNFWSNY